MRGSRVLKGSKERLQAILAEQPTHAGRITVAGYAVADACRMAETTAHNLVGRVELLRSQHALSDPDILRRLDLPPHGSVAVAAAAVARATGMSELASTQLLTHVRELQARRYRDTDIVRRLAPTATFRVG